MSGLADKAFFDAFLEPENAKEHFFWSLIVRFNAHPFLSQEQNLTSPLADPSLLSWLAQVPDAVRSGIPSRDDKAEFFWDFTEDSRKLALLDDKSLVHLALVAGVTLHARELAKIVERSARGVLCNALGESLFAYALARGQYQTGAAEKIVANRDIHLPLEVRCQTHGWLALRLCAMPWPDALRNRFIHRLEIVSGCPSGLEERLDDSHWQALWRMLKKCLLREVVPSWAAYFTA